MRIFKKIFRKLYHLIYFLCAFFLFSPLVLATDGSTNGSVRTSDIFQSTQAQCYNNNHSSITTTFVNNQGYSSYYQCNLNSDRAYLSLNVNHALVTDTLYQITLYIGNNGNKPIGNPGSYGAVGTSVNNANSNNQNGNDRLTFWAFNDTWNILNYIQVDNGELDTQPRSAATGMYYITFTTPVDGRTFLNIPIYFGSSTSQLYYYGYNLQVIGRTNGLTRNDVQSVINSSGLATANSVNEVKQGVNEVKQQLTSIDSTLNNSSVDSSDSTLNSLKSQIPTNSVISDLLLLPVRFLQNFVNSLGSSCSQFSLGSLYGTNLYMPCINLENYLGSAIWATIDLILSGLFVYSLRKKFIEIYQNLTNLKNGGNEVD